MESTAWRHFPATTEITAIIDDLVQRLHNQSLLEQSITLSQKQSPQPQYVHWLDHSITSGYAGMAVLDAYLDACFPGQGCDLAGYHYLQRATHNLNDVSASLSSGLSGLSFAVTLLSRDGTRYAHLLTDLHERIIPIVSWQIKQMSAQQHGFGSSQFDVISGLAGIGAYLLCHTQDPICRAALHDVGTVLVALSGERDGLPHWYVPSAQIMQPHWRPTHPAGLLDSGLAHGVSGPLAILALMYHQGEIMPGHRTALKKMADWLLLHRCDDEWGLNWATVYPVHTIGQAPQPARAAWCYGAPGIARALWLTGNALNEDVYIQAALEAMEVVYRKPVAARMIDAPCLCHGIAGLLMITLRFWNDTHLPMFEKAARDLLTQLVDLYDPNTLMGYRDLGENNCLLDRSDLLCGSIGVTLTLLAASHAVEPSWDRLMLLA